MFDCATVGNGRNDAIRRVYATNFDGHLYEFSWDGTSWVREDMGQAGKGFIIVKIGDGRNDGKFHVYASNMDGHLYEYA